MIASLVKAPLGVAYLAGSGVVGLLAWTEAARDWHTVGAVSLTAIILGAASASLLGAAADLLGWAKPAKDGAADAIARSVWATRQTLEAAGIIRSRKAPPTNEGLYLGVFTDKAGSSELRYYGEKHILCFGAPGAFKSMGIVTPNLANLRRSVLIIDVKLQLAAITANARAKLGEVIVINPFGLFLDALPHLESRGWNPMLQLDLASLDFEDGARCIASAWADKSSDGAGNARFFEMSAENLSTALVMWERLTKGHEARLYNIRSTLCEPTVFEGKTRAPKSGFLHTLLKMSGCPYPAVANVAGRLFSRLTDANSQSTSAQDVIDTVLANTRFLDNPAIRDDMNIGGAIDFASLHRKITTVYFALPPDQLEGQCAKFLRIFVNLALQQLYKNPRPINENLPPVLFMLDEFANLGRLTEITRALTISRDYGVQLAMFCHHIGQLRAHYPDEWPGFFTGSGAIATFRTGDAETAEYLCKLYGNRVEYVPTESENGQVSNTIHAVPLIRQEDIGRLGRGEMISLIEPYSMPIKGAAPVYTKTPYGIGLDPNPYYRG